MNILERTTTEEYDEDGRLTSRTTVEKYGDDGPMLPEPVNTLAEREPPKSDEDVAVSWHEKIDAAMNKEQYQIFALQVMVKMARKWPDVYESADKIARDNFVELKTYVDKS